MTKRIAALLVAVILPMTMLFAGCGSKRLSVAEYRDQMKEYWTEFMQTNTAWTKMASEDLPQTDAEKSKYRDIISRREKALDGIKKINPPQEYTDKHKAIVASLDYEYKWNAAALKLVDAKTEDEAEKIGAELQNIVNSIPDGQSLPLLYLQLYRELKNM